MRGAPGRALTRRRREEHFWSSGLGLDVQYRHTADGTPGRHSLLMVGWPEAGWHLELVHHPAAPVDPRPTVEDLLVIYLGEPVPGTLVERLEQHGGKRVPAHNPYWDTWGVTVQDPDGCLLVLSTRVWPGQPQG
ncbi:VOC family protein [Streptomyces sp. B5E4]|uniref:VOC family protein n=1 Tax=Streptomyces sp. B5E4 TaxID=3153568 RepID=UPI00325E648C